MRNNDTRWPKRYQQHFYRQAVLRDSDGRNRPFLLTRRPLAHAVCVPVVEPLSVDYSPAHTQRRPLLPRFGMKEFVFVGYNVQGLPVYQDIA